MVDLTAQYDELINLIEIKGLKYPTIIVDALSRIRALSASILRRVDVWDASTAVAPSSDPQENDYWVVSVAGTFDGEEYEIGDWCVYTTVEGWSKIGNQGIGGGVVYRGTYDANVEPSYPAGAFKGDFYVISAAGDLDGDDFNALDWIVYNGATWDIVDNSTLDIILDTAYPVGWDTDTTHTASRNAIFDAIVAAIGAGGHLHNTDILELDGIDSDGGAFPFDTTGAVTFNQAVIIEGLATVDGLVPEADLADSLGTAALTWLELYVQDLKDAAGNIVFSNDGAGKIDALGNISAAVIMESTLVVQGLATVDGLVPEGDLADDLGSAALTWLNLYVQDIYDAGGNQILGTDGAGLIDALANLSCNIVFDGAQTVDGVDVSVLNTAYNAHLHDTHILELDGIDSDVGAFPFDTTGAVTFNQSITLATAAIISSANEDLIFNFGRNVLHSTSADWAMLSNRAGTIASEYIGIDDDGTIRLATAAAKTVEVIVDSVTEFAFDATKLYIGTNTISLKEDVTDGQYSGISAEVTVASNAFGFGAALYMKADGEYAECDADDSAKLPCVALALAAGTGSIEVLHMGYICDSSWSFTRGQPVYVDTDLGDLTTTRPLGSGDQVQRVGIATTTTALLFMPSMDVGQVL